MKSTNLKHIGPENIESGTGRIIELKTAESLGLMSGKYVFDEYAIVYSKIRPNLNKVCLPNFRGLCSADAYPLWPTEDIVIREFLFYSLLSPQFVRQSIAVSMRTGMPKINRSDLNRLLVDIPEIPEQKRIVSLLSTWDRAIEQTERLIAAKRRRKQGLMQQLLTGKRRFKEFGKLVVKHGDLPKGWKRTQIGNIFKEVTDKVGSRDIPPYSITAGTGFVSHEEKWGKNIAGSQHSNYTLLRKGQFSYNKGNSKRYPCGCMYRLEHVEEIAVPSVFISFESRGEVCDEFYKQYFMADLCASELRRYITSGARSDGLLNISKDDFFSVSLPLPQLLEQRRIAAVLNVCDTELERLSVQLVAFKEQKKGLMQHLLTGKVRVKV